MGCFWRLVPIKYRRRVINIFLQWGQFTKTVCGICHDRFIIVDQKELFWTGASLKDAGRLTFAAAKMGAEVIPGLLASIRKATSESVAYPTGKIEVAKRKGGWK